MNEQTRSRTLRMIQLAILSAIIILMAFTPLGFLRYGSLEITFSTLPVIIGAIFIGPAGGAFLGGVFGLTSFAQAFGLNPFGAALLAINPFYLFVLTMVPRILTGWLAGLICRALLRTKRPSWLAYMVSSLSGALLNSVLFLGALVLLFGQTDLLQSFGSTGLAIIVALAGINVLVEVPVITLAGTAVAKALEKSMGKKPLPSDSSDSADRTAGG